MTVAADAPLVSHQQPVLAARRAPVRAATTPNRLRLAALGCAGLAVLVGLFGVVTASSRFTSTSTAWESTEPLMVDAQAIDTSLSDADTTAAGSFLQGQLESTTSHSRYLSDIAGASDLVSTTTGQVGEDGPVASALRTITVDLPAYTGLIQTATFNQRQANFPLAAAYMAEANALMHSQILPAASEVYATERARLAAEQHRASSPGLLAVTVILLVVLVVTLVLTQRWLSRHFRRTVNVAIGLATAVVVLIGVWFTVAVVAQGMAVDSAAANGSRPVATYTQARIDALEMRADDELTLLSRDSVSSYQVDESSTLDDLQRLLASASVGASRAEQVRLTDAVGALDGYRTAHDQIRRTDAGGDLIGAVEEASAPGPAHLPAASALLDQDLAGDITGSQQTFDRSMTGATGDVGTLRWGMLVLSLVAAALVVAGIRPRMAEYR